MHNGDAEGFLDDDKHKNFDTILEPNYWQLDAGIERRTRLKPIPDIKFLCPDCGSPATVTSDEPLAWWCPVCNDPNSTQPLKGE